MADLSKSLFIYSNELTAITNHPAVQNYGFGRCDETADLFINVKPESAIGQKLDRNCRSLFFSWAEGFYKFTWYDTDGNRRDVTYHGDKDTANRRTVDIMVFFMDFASDEILGTKLTTYGRPAHGVEFEFDVTWDERPPNEGNVVRFPERPKADPETTARS